MTTSDERRATPLYAGALGTLLGVGIALLVFPARSSDGPGPLTPPHTKAKLQCAQCHQKHEQGAPAFIKTAQEACVGCHGPHPSTREGHRRAAKDGQLGCVTCHTIHGPQSGVRLPPSGPAVRYSTWGEQTIDELVQNGGQKVLVPTIHAGACLKCHQDTPNDPFQRCRSGALGGDLDPTVCFDEHRPALTAATASGKNKAKGVCKDQHTDDRPFAWEVARQAVLKVPRISTTREAGSPLAWLGLGGLGGALGFGSARLLLRRKRKASQPASQPTTTRRLPVIDTSTCLGCYACVDACPYDVLEVQRYVAVLARPDACCGLTLCEQRCPNGSLTMGQEQAGPPRVPLRANLESEQVPGVYLAGDITGSSLIKSAISQGDTAARSAVAGLPTRPNADGVQDVVIIGAGPAGIAAALRLSEHDLRYQVFEQGEVAHSIQSFPRGKLVFDQPLELPSAGKLWLEESTKEELVMRWMRIVRKAKLPILSGTRVVGVTQRPDGLFAINTLSDAGHQTTLARSLIVAIGHRGSPRKLPIPIPNHMESKVFYSLADARSWAGQRLIVVGLGDVAMETALALASQPGTSVTILHRGATYSRGQKRNIDELERQRRAGRIELCFESEVAEVGAGYIVARTGNTTRRLPCDGMFVLVGSIPSFETLERIGIRKPGRPVAQNLTLPLLSLTQLSGAAQAGPKAGPSSPGA